MFEIPKKLTSITFGTYTDAEIIKLSVAEIHNPHTFGDIGHPNSNGLHDLRLGPQGQYETCRTCNLGELHCPGHMGHIQLPIPLFHPLWLRQLIVILRGSCFSCHRFLDTSTTTAYIVNTLRLINAGRWDLLDEMTNTFVNGDVKRENLEEEMSKFVENAIKDLDVNGESPRSLRFINQEKTDLLTQYVNTAFKNVNGMCSHCMMPTRKLRLEQHAKLYFDEGVSERALNKSMKALVNKGMDVGKTKKKVKMDPDLMGLVEDSDEDIKEPIEQFRESDEKIVAELSRLKSRALLTPDDIKSHMRKLWKNESVIISQICGMLNIPLDEPKSGEDNFCPTDAFFLSVLPVAPTKFRPLRRVGGRTFESERNGIYTAVLGVCRSLTEKMSQINENEMTKLRCNEEVANQSLTKLFVSLNRDMVELQSHVNNVLDSSLNKLPGDIKPTGFKQVIEKKEGLFRKHMMGKRVDFAARSVISPDPFIAVDEVGMPMVFAKRLTFPEPVSFHNVERLRRAVINGPNQHPGATHVIDERGFKTLLTSDVTQREALAKTLIATSDTLNTFSKPKTVLRHLRDGDMIIMNRQPTLHRPSIQAHKCHVLPGERTIRLHYANCNAYNADFDGDEMNAHFPQTFIGQSEARQIVGTKIQYLVPKSGTPLAGLIQDHVIGGVTLTTRGRFFTQFEYQQLVYSGLVDQKRRVELVEPCILKPHKLWSGKQVISTILRNVIPVKSEESYINLTGVSKISAKSWVNSEVSETLSDMGEETVIIRKGLLLQGVLDKNHYGATSNGLVHSCYELYGGQCSSDLLTSLGRLFTTFLSSKGFTLGVKDILCTRKADRKRRGVMETASDQGKKKMCEALNVDMQSEAESCEADIDKEIKRRYAEVHFDSSQRLAEIDMHMKRVSDTIQNEVTKAIMPRGLLQKFPVNNLQLMVTAGAKGSSVNCMQISCLLGQIELEGRRPPLMLSGRSLPSFKPYDTAPRAGGFVDGRFLSGIRPQEYFFHCMAGREGLIDTAVKTSRSGYLQRCLVKHLEGIMVEYDSTVRDSDGSVIQFNYGEDSFSTLKVNLLNKKQFPFLISNRHSVNKEETLNKLKAVLNTKKARSWDRKIRKFRNQYSEILESGVRRYSPFLKYSSEEDAESKSATETVSPKTHRSEFANNLVKDFRSLDGEYKEQYDMYLHRLPDPTVSKYSPDRYLFSLPEKLGTDMGDYSKTNPHHLLVNHPDNASNNNITSVEFEELVSLFALKARAEPGDAVGVLAAQSIGEPSTQMTLNTFHFAGRGEMNVTLGIPRLREILMVASKSLKTPSMTIPFHQTKYAQHRAKGLQLKLNAVYLSEVLSNVHITSQLHTRGHSQNWGKVVKVRLEFLTPDQYKEFCLLTPSSILKSVELYFINVLVKQYLLAIKHATEVKLLNALRQRVNIERPEVSQTATNDDAEETTPNDDTGANDDVDEMDLKQEVDEGDFDSVVKKEFERHDEEHEYEEETEVQDYQADDTLAQQDTDSDNVSDEEVNLDMSDLKQSAKKRIKQEAEMRTNDMNHARTDRVKKYNRVEKYTYDAENELWCEITFKFNLAPIDVDMAPVVRSLASNILINDPADTVRGVNKALLSKPTNYEDPVNLITEGVNIQKMFQFHKLLDYKKLYSNDIHAMARTFGIEAASKVLIKEIRDVFSAYGIAVNYRHLSLIADYMTFDGVYKPFNRVGLSNHASAFQRMTFESATTFLKTATMNREKDDLESPSASIIVGKPIRIGTGSFELQQKLFNAVCS